MRYNVAVLQGRLLFNSRDDEWGGVGRLGWEGMRNERREEERRGDVRET